MSFLRRIDDQTQSGSTGTISLNSAGFNQPQLVVDHLTLHLSITGTGDGTTWSPSSFLNASTLAAYWREGNQGSAKTWISTVPLLFLGWHATTVYDGALDSIDNELIAAGYATNVGATTIELFVRVPVSLARNLDSGDDTAIRASELGDLIVTFGGNTDVSLAITSVRARLNAICRPSRSASWCGLRSRIEFQSSKSPSTTDSVRLDGRKLAYLHFGNTAGTSNAGVTNPRIDVDGFQLIDGMNLDSIVSIPQTRGEPLYPQATSQAAYTSSTWVPLIVPELAQKVSELPAGDAVNLTYAANPIAAGAGFYIMHSIYPQTEQELVQRGLSPEAASAAVANAGKPVPASVLPWLPYQ